MRFVDDIRGRQTLFKNQRDHSKMSRSHFKPKTLYLLLNRALRTGRRLRKDGIDGTIHEAD